MREQVKQYFEEQEQVKDDLTQRLSEIRKILYKRCLDMGYTKEEIEKYLGKEL